MDFIKENGKLINIFKNNNTISELCFVISFSKKIWQFSVYNVTFCFRLNLHFILCELPINVTSIVNVTLFDKLKWLLSY